MNYIKKLVIEIEESDGGTWTSEIDGLNVMSIDIDRPVWRDYIRDRFAQAGPDIITIKLEAWGGMWVGTTTKSRKNITPPPKQLPSPIKQLPEHKDE